MVTATSIAGTRISAPKRPATHPRSPDRRCGGKTPASSGRAIARCSRGLAGRRARPTRSGRRCWASRSTAISSSISTATARVLPIFTFRGTSGRATAISLRNSAAVPFCFMAPVRVRLSRPPRASSGRGSKREFPERPVADSPFTTTLELRGQSDVGADLADADASALWRFLQRHGFIVGDPGRPPDLLCHPTPLAGSDNLVAPVAGVVSYRLAPGEKVNAGDVVADIVDPAEADWRKARTPVASRASGILYGRRMSRLVRPGQSFAVVSGDVELPPPDPPAYDW